MQTLFAIAGSSAQLDSSVDTSQTLRDSLKRSGPSPVIVFSDNSHFQVVLMNAVSKMATLFDPFGNSFPAPVRDTVKTFFDSLSISKRSLWEMDIQDLDTKTAD